MSRFPAGGIKVLHEVRKGHITQVHTGRERLETICNFEPGNRLVRAAKKRES